MEPATFAGLAVILIASQQRRMMNQEEEEVRPVGGPGWEYKIVRSYTAGFRTPANLRRMLATEAGAGWDLFEKFDDYRVRLRRPVSERARDIELGRDAYRTNHGPSQLVLTLLVLVVLLLFFGVMVWVLV